MSFINNLRAGLAIAEELRKHLPEIRETLALLAELRQRKQRDASVGDLDDSLAVLDSLDR